MARGDDSTDFDLRVELLVRGARRADAKTDRAVGEVEDLVRLERRRKAFPGDRHPRRVPDAFGATLERDHAAWMKLRDAVAQGADPQLRPGKVLEDRDRMAGTPGRVAHALGRLGVLLERPVRVIESRDVHPGLDQLEEDVGFTRGGTDGGDDLRAAHCEGAQ